MRVLIYGFSGRILGGIETFILNMNEHMSKDTIFDYIIDGDECVYRDRIEKRGGQIFFVPGVRKHPLAYIKTFWHTLGEQHKAGTTIFYVQLFSMANMLPVFLAKMRGFKVILHAHNSGLQSKSVVYGLIHKIGQMLTNHGDYIRFTNSTKSSEFMFGKAIKSEIIYNAIDLERFSFHQEWRDEIRESMSSGNRKVVGFVGRLSDEKNPLFALQVFAEYHKVNTNSEMWFVGEGVQKEDLVQTAKSLRVLPSVKFLGRRNDVEKVMCGMDLLLQPSLFEGLGIVLIEAQATGLPCLSSADVIPEEAKATDLLCLQSLKDSPSVWAETCKHITELSQTDRSKVNFPSTYDITKEALRLEQKLRDYK